MKGKTNAGGSGKNYGPYVWRKRLLQTTTCRVYATVESRTNYTQTYKINLEGDTSIFTFEKIIGKKISRITNSNTGGYEDFIITSKTQATGTDGNGNSSTKTATWNESTMTYQINASWTTKQPISDLMDTTISNTVTLAETFIVNDNPSAYPNNGYHTDGYYYELIASTASANVMSLSDGALDTVQQDYRDQIETEVSNA